MKKYIICFIEVSGGVDFTDPKTEKEYKLFIKKYSKDWIKYYITEIIKEINSL